jgi:hypothetical protein
MKLTVGIFFRNSWFSKLLLFVILTRHAFMNAQVKVYTQFKYKMPFHIMLICMYGLLLRKCNVTIFVHPVPKCNFW